MEWKDYIFDIESYPNFFCCHITMLNSGEITRYRLNDVREFMQIYNRKDVRLWGMNSSHYDDYMLAGWMMGKTPSQLNVLSHNLIELEIIDRYRAIEGYNDILDFMETWNFVRCDLMKLIGKVNGLKMLAIIIGWHKLEELPFDPSLPLTEEQKVTVSNYCDNDVAITEELFNIVLTGGTKDVSTRASITTRDMFYDDGILDAYRITSPKLAEKDLIKTYKDATGVDLNSRERVNHTKGYYRKEIPLKDVMVDIEFESMVFKSLYNRYTHKVVKFELSGGRLQPTSDSSLSENIVDKNGMGYSLGIGGLHSENDRFFIDKVPDGKLIVNSDVGGYYPALMYTQGMNPGHMQDGFYPKFIKGNIDSRNECKSQIGTVADAKAKSDGYKLKNNAGFGKWGDPFSPLYDFAITLETTINGQMKLLKLIDMYFSKTDAYVINANTDGVAVVVSEKYRDTILGINREWEAMYGLVLEEDYYNKWFQKSCNIYLAQDVNGKVKSINEFQTTYHLEKGMTMPKIIPIAVRDYLIYGKPIEDTVMCHHKLQEYIMASKKGKGYDVLYDGVVTSNINRYYRSTSGKDLTYYDKVKGTSGLIPKASSVTICNDIESMYLIPSDIDYSYYINNAWNMVNNVKFGFDGDDDVNGRLIYDMFTEDRDALNFFINFTDLPLICNFSGMKDYKNPSVDPSTWLNNSEVCSGLNIKLGDGYVAVKGSIGIQGGLIVTNLSTGDEYMIVKSDTLKDTSNLVHRKDGSSWSDNIGLKGFEVISDKTLPIWGYIRGEYYSCNFGRVEEYNASFDTSEYKKKGSPKVFLTVSKSVMDTGDLKTHGFSLGNDIINWFMSTPVFTGNKDEAPMVNLCKYGSDRAVSENVLSVSGLMLDIDGESTIEEICTMFDKYRYVYYTSASHTPECHKFRFILPFSKAISKAEYEGYKKSIVETLKGKVDTSSTAMSRRFYLPTANRSGGCTKDYKDKGRYLQLSDMFTYEAVNNEIAMVSEKSSLGSVWYKVILKDLKRQFRNGFYVNNRHQAIVNFTVALSKAGYNEDDVFAEMMDEPLFSGRSKYSDSHVRSVIKDVLRRQYNS